ncbi:hypothetical protein AXF42_Ash020954 [Apostasia shenzhenica]|uniref:Uncharacterized protein n=1 Tax=Apostasia shenzhenica TaxID=1088818 RepID=A0A2H9ZYK3_9ASPA|nr:hypothetical protein AXF42_Ash020954 [Apostasia shenzhenica]
MGSLVVVFNWASHWTSLRRASYVHNYMASIRPLLLLLLLLRPTTVISPRGPLMQINVYDYAEALRILCNRALEIYESAQDGHSVGLQAYAGPISYVLAVLATYQTLTPRPIGLELMQHRIEFLGLHRIGRNHYVMEVFIVGHDWGAMVAWNLCLFRPDKLPIVGLEEEALRAPSNWGGDKTKLLRTRKVASPLPRLKAQPVQKLEEAPSVSQLEARLVPDLEASPLVPKLEASTMPELEALPDYGPRSNLGHEDSPNHRPRRSRIIPRNLGPEGTR